MYVCVSVYVCVAVCVCVCVYEDVCVSTCICLRQYIDEMKHFDDHLPNKLLVRHDLIKQLLPNKEYILKDLYNFPERSDATILTGSFPTCNLRDGVSAERSRWFDISCLFPMGLRACKFGYQGNTVKIASSY